MSPQREAVIFPATLRAPFAGVSYRQLRSFRLPQAGTVTTSFDHGVKDILRFAGRGYVASIRRHQDSNHRLTNFYSELVCRWYPRTVALRYRRRVCIIRYF